jgi:hydroxypyruvate isomerase
MNRRRFAQALATAAVGAATGEFSTRAEASRKAETAETPFPLSVMLWTVDGKLPFERRLEMVAEAGYHNVELVGEYREWTAVEYARANAARKRLKLSFDATAGLGHGIGDPAARDAFLADLKQAMTPMETLGCPAMIVLSGNVVAGLTREEQHQSCVDGLKRAAELVEGRSIDGQAVRLLLECIDQEENPKYFLERASEAIEVVRAVGHPQVQFLYDIFHQQIAEGNLIEKLEEHIDAIGLIHVADVPGRHEPGTGEINYANIYRKLAELKYGRMVAMEFRPSGETVASLKAARMMVAESVRG